MLTATNIDLREAVKAGRFREDLFYRLNLLTITVPPLRERPDDIPEIVDYYLGYYATNYGKPGITVDPETLNRLMQYDWPGNIRELCNVVERAVLLNKSGIIMPDEVNIAIKTGRLTIADRQQIIIDVPPQGITLLEVERSVVKQVLNLVDWNKSEAARLLGISRPRLRRILDSEVLDQNRRDT